MGTATPPALEHFNEPVKVTIEGTVVDIFGVGIPGIQVAVTQGQLTIALARSAEDGVFAFPGISTKVGNHVVRATGTEYSTGEEPLTIVWDDRDETIVLMLRLERKTESEIEMARKEEFRQQFASEERLNEEIRRKLEQNLEALTKRKPSSMDFNSVPEEWDRIRELIREYGARAEVIFEELTHAPGSPYKVIIPSTDPLQETLKDREDDEDIDSLDDENQDDEGDEDLDNLEGGGDIEDGEGEKRVDDHPPIKGGSIGEDRSRKGGSLLNVPHKEYSVKAGSVKMGSGNILIEREGFSVCPVWFATDRARTLNTDPAKTFANARPAPDTPPMSYGVCEVTVPNRPNHKIGAVERPNRFFKLLFDEDPRKHVTIRRCLPCDEESFYKSMSECAALAQNGGVLLFLHGYSVTFAEGIYRTAQMAVDLNFNGVPLCFSWASAGRYSGYWGDEATSTWSIPHVRALLEQIATLNSVKTIHVIAHSMGSRILLECLNEIAVSKEVATAKKIGQLCLAAPDIDTGRFHEIAKDVAKLSRRTTLYASSNDKALRASNRFHGGYTRAGWAGKDMVVCDFLDTVDASAVKTDILGHSYFGSTRTVLHDVYDLIGTGKAPPRFGLEKASLNNLPYWIFVP
jgi:esterase/lipase superfamily enzyme